MQNEEVFQRVFWAFHPSIKGFKHCHHVLTIDGTHLYGKYKGTVMIAMGCDGNNQLFPHAFALTEGENVRVPPIRGRGRGDRRAGHQHVPLASTLVQPSHPPVTSTFPLFQSFASLESALSPPDVSTPAHSS